MYLDGPLSRPVCCLDVPLLLSGLPEATKLGILSQTRYGTPSYCEWQRLAGPAHRHAGAYDARGEGGGRFSRR